MYRISRPLLRRLQRPKAPRLSYSMGTALVKGFVGIITMPPQPPQPPHAVRLTLSRGPDETITSSLPQQLANAPPSSAHLTLDSDIPSDEDWALVSNHFTSVTQLYMESGWDEHVGDRGIPMHWPLEKLTLSSASADVCQSPWILEGKVRHLVFHYTSELRFEGPTTAELYKAHMQAVEQGTKQPRSTTSGGMMITYVPDLVHEWEDENAPKEEAEAVMDPSRFGADRSELHLRVLEIVGNNTHQTLFRYVSPNLSIIDHLETLSLVEGTSYGGVGAPSNLLEGVLAQPKALKTLALTLDEGCDDLHALINILPPSLEVLRFRSSVSLAETQDTFEATWGKAFSNPDFLPNLKTLSFVLDLTGGKETETEEWKETMKVYKEAHTVVRDAHDRGDSEIPYPPRPRVSDKALAHAKRACERLWRTAESRGVKVESFSEPWCKEFTSLLWRHPLDERWEGL